MIQYLSLRYTKTIACCLLALFYTSIVLPLYGNMKALAATHRYYYTPGSRLNNFNKATAAKAITTAAAGAWEKEDYIDGPTQPEMTSFKSIGTDNMVDLFSGNFSYNIPLLDVGGYPVNIFYNSGIGMEQEASWVGLGWNINPGTISRNMRGVPDDFNGQDTMVQSQTMKPNITWGVSGGGDVEGIGIKDLFSFGASVGMSFNNYLGPAFDLSMKGGVNFKVADKIMSEKSTCDSSALKLKISVGADINSRTGVTFSPAVSLTASAFKGHETTSLGLTAATSYNSRTGIKELQISEQGSFTKTAQDTYVKSVDEDGVATMGTRNYSSTFARTLHSNSITFARPSYTPAIRMPVTNEAYSGHFQLGGGLFGGYASAEVEAYRQTASVGNEDTAQYKPLVGYLYYQNAVDNPNAVMDFTRLNDKEVTPNTTVISAPQYTYDVFSIQGEGTGGAIRAYRNDLGYVRDNYTTSKDKSLSIGVDIGPPGHYGANYNTIHTPSTIGDWNTGNKLKAVQRFTVADGVHENVYFRNPSEKTVVNMDQINKMGGTDLVRYQLGGYNHAPTVEPVLQRFNDEAVSLGTVNTTAANTTPFSRQKRQQVITFLTAEEAVLAGLEKDIRSYNAGLNSSNMLTYASIARIGGYRKKHHLSQINVTEPDGKRYVYGIPAYNIRQKDFTFSVDQAEAADDPGKVALSDLGLMGTSSRLVAKSSKVDGYVQVTQTPAYAHSFLLSGLLSPDYVDVTGDGISDDDLGSAVKFNYSCVKATDGSYAVHKWRTPLTTGDKANFNKGKYTETKDDKGLISYGERESWYMHSIESKTMIAIFTLDNRQDGKGTLSEHGGIDGNDVSQKMLKQIDLYSKSDLKQNGIANAKPIKTVRFNYSFTLCAHTPDNTTGGGKLTLESIDFAYNGQQRANKNRYVFSYLNGTAGNPDYEFNGSDRWGNYKPKSMNPQQLKNSEYPYSIQDQAQSTTIGNNAAAWSLKKILLPSGGQIEVNYESDDYAYVQNKRAMDMMQVVGLGKDATGYTNTLYDWSDLNLVDNNFLYIKVPEACSSKSEVLAKYLDGVEQLYVKMMVMMPKGPEPVPSYANIADYGLYGDGSVIWVQMKTTSGYSPLALSSAEFLRQQLPGQAFPGYDVSDEGTLEQVGDMLMGMLSALKNSFSDPVNAIRGDGKGKYVDVNSSFVRLNDPDGVKYGGGLRVKSVQLKNNWDVMTKQYGATYGQVYNYQTTEVLNGKTRIISSGVASYEPSIGGEENPFQTILQVSDQLPLGPTNYGAIEMPVLDAFFPAASVGYSKVTVKAMNNVAPTATQKPRSGIGRQVTEFYTAKDFPVSYSYTSFDAASDKQSHTSSVMSFWTKYAFDSRALSQGFLVTTNNMHGQLKSQSSFAENDDNNRIGYKENFYKNTGAKGLDEKFDFVYATQGGVVNAGNMGIDVELMTDLREFSVKTSSQEWQAQLDFFPAPIPTWLPFPWPVFGSSENTYRAVTTTKVVNYHCVLDSELVIDKGSQAATKMMLYDAESGNTVVTRTNNEFNQPVYSTTYPAYWGYSGMGMAYKNSGAIYRNVNFYDGKITNTEISMADFESGDEVFIIDSGSMAPKTCELVIPSYSAPVLWAFDKNKNTTSLTVTTPDFLFLDQSGKTFTRNKVTIKVLRSGRRNLLAQQVAGVTSMQSPVVTANNVSQLSVTGASKVVNASAIEYREKWATDNDNILRYVLTINNTLCTETETPNCAGYLEKSINPYKKGLLGNFTSNRNLVYYGNRAESSITPDANVKTNLSQYGFMDNTFKLYWDFNTQHQFLPDAASTQWVWNSEITRLNEKGMELENHNVLGIYNAAQYGYDKTLPLAITSNARYHEAAYAGFEDVNYAENINTAATFNCGTPHFDLSNVTNSQIVTAASEGIAAHTGKNVLKILAGKTAVKQLTAGPAPAETYSLAIGTQVDKTLSEPGVNLDYFNYSPINMNFYNSITGNPQQIAINPGNPFTNGDVSGGSSQSYGYTVQTSTYYKFDHRGVYRIYYRNTTPNDSYETLSGYVNVYDLDGNLMPLTYFDNPTGYTVYNVCLAAGIYKLVTHGQGDYYYYLSGYDNGGFPAPPADLFESGFTTDEGLSHLGIYNGYTSYQNITEVDGCTANVPIGGTDAMMNPVFTIPTAKKMWFSAWVKDNATIMPDTYSQVQLTSNGNAINVPVKPTGPVIDGWQKMEGDFTLPANATYLSMSLVNNTSSPIYFDDIRIQPYNANMKGYVYDPVNLRLMAQLDANNYASFYEYDEEGTLIRTKAETKDGIKTITETRSAKQKNITTIQ